MNNQQNKNCAPSHPGALLRDVVLPEPGITQGELADRLVVSRRTVSEILHERRPVTLDMAVRLVKSLGNGAGLWLRMQQAVDIWTLEQLATMPTSSSSRPHRVSPSHMRFMRKAGRPGANTPCNVQDAR